MLLGKLFSRHHATDLKQYEAHIISHQVFKSFLKTEWVVVLFYLTDEFYLTCGVNLGSKFQNRYIGRPHLYCFSNA